MIRVKALALLLVCGAALPATAQPRPRTILFVGNSFTQGAHSPVRNWHSGTVVDLNRDGYGGVPALFKEFTREVGLDYAVSLETQGGKSLAFHFEERRALLERAWDVVVLQELSTLDAERPGDPTSYLRSVPRLSALFHGYNPAVQIELMATWSRADETYRSRGHWYGRPITAMALDMRTAANRARATTRGIAGVLPVGEAWNRAMLTGVADPNPYDGVPFGKLDLWSYDQYHASVYGYYLEALVVFGRITGVDPLVLGKDENAADELGVSPAQAVALQRVAHDQLAAEIRVRR